LKTLLEGNPIAVSIVRHVTFDHLSNDPTALWSLLLFAGYLRIDTMDAEYSLGQLKCQLSIPNQEVMELFVGFFTHWFARHAGRSIYTTQHLDYLLAENVSGFTAELTHYLTHTSFHDTGENTEMFYHGFILAAVSPLKATHTILSNRESGKGRYDVAIIPHSAKQGDLGILLEFKRVKKTEHLEATAKEALQQIHDKQYDHELQQKPHIKKILRIGMAFSGKAVTAAYQYWDRAQEVLSEVVVV
jgi:hypothetical protein